MTRPLTRVTNAAVLAVALWAAATAVSVAGFAFGRWLDGRASLRQT